MKRTTTLKISRATSDDKKLFPFIRIKGRWLEKLGWTIGEKVNVEADKLEIIIRKMQNEQAQDSGGVSCEIHS